MMNKLQTYLCVIIVLAFNNGYNVAYGSSLTVTASPSSTTVNENDDDPLTLSTISCDHNPCSCSAASGFVSGLISFDTGSKQIKKASCSPITCGSCTGCGACSTSNGCLTAPATYTVGISCTYYVNASITYTGSTSVSISVLAETPTLTISLPASTNANNGMSSGTVIATASKSSGPDIVGYRKSVSVANSLILGTANLFDLQSDGDIIVNSDPLNEYDDTYSMTVCIQSRRQESCQAITINFDGCFETPNCDNQEGEFDDRFDVSGTLFTMTYDPPSSDFSGISSDWQNLQFAIVSSTFGTLTTIDATTGAITTTGNITVWPAYPYATHSIVVRVTNPGHSCDYSSTCTMSIKFYFYNWPISITSLPDTTWIHEDTDAQTLVHNITTFDYNNPLHDNVTCVVTYNENSTLLFLDHDGNHSFDSYNIYKHRCTDPGCGFICTANGCMNYDLDNEFVITIKCMDAYDSEDEQSFTLRISENQPPVWTNVPNTQVINSDRTSHLDVLFSIFYTDAENEVLAYNYSIAPDQPAQPLFGYDSIGNYHNSPANITALKFFWDQVNSTYELDFCGTERRNMVCSSLTLEVREYCGPTPSCNDGAVTVTDQFAVSGTLLTIDLNAAPAGNSYTDITYVIVSATSGLFTVNPDTGVVTTLAPLSVSNPPNQQTHVLTANVYDTAACGFGACTLRVTVTFTNFDISITSMDNINISLHEDHTAEVMLHTIVTSDASDVDDVFCYRDTANSVPSDTDIFTVEETDTGSNVFRIISRELPGFDYDVRTSYFIAVICEDNYGSSDTGNMTVTILENQRPTIDNLITGDVIVVDPMTYFSGATLFTLATSDAEDDTLYFSCTVENSFVPLHCLNDGVVSMRRDVLVPDEDGEIYNITLCIEEPIHNHTLCETLNVNFTSSKTNPEIGNLPASVEVAENAAVGTLIYNVSVVDPDIGDVHTFTMTAYPTGTSFNFDRNDGALTLRSDLDYETTDTYWFVFSVRDIYLPGLEDKILRVNVTDINEAPTLHLGQTTFITYEENATYEIATIPYNCTDPDFGQNMTLTITAGTHASYFNLNDSRFLSFASNWDFEVETLPSTTTLEITCSDGNGLTDVANIVVNINRKNEFVPVLNTYAENFTIYSNQTLLDSLLTITANDSDFGHDGVFNFQIVGDGQGVEYFALRGSEGNSVDLYIKDYINWNYNYTFVLTIEVSDAENEALTSSVFVTVTYIAPEMPIPTKAPMKCLLCTTIGIALVSTLCVEGFLILVMTCHVMKRMSIWEICKTKVKPRKVEDKQRRRRNKDVDTGAGYRPNSAMLNRALPKSLQPPKGFYDPPITPSAAKYEPSRSEQNLEKLPDPTKQRADNSLRDNVVTPTNVTFFHPIDDFNVKSKGALAPPLPKARRRHQPSLFQDPNNAPPGFANNADLFYKPSLEDRTPSGASNDSFYEDIPMFGGRPDARAIYGDNSSSPGHALDF